MPSFKGPSLPRPGLPAERLRERAAARSERLLARRGVRQSIVSLAGLIGAAVTNQSGQDVGRVVDVVARVHGTERYPPVTGMVVRVGRRRAYLDAADIAAVTHDAVRLRRARLDLREFRRRAGEVLLARDVLDHQLVDVDGVQVIRAADLYLAPVGDQVRLVGVDVSAQSLLRRLGPRALRGRPTPDRVIDWDAVQPFGDELVESPAAVHLRARNQGLPRLHPAELADLLEDLDRAARQELLSALEPERAADALEEMEPAELAALLREAEPARAAELLDAMESDEAVDALRDLTEDEREEILAALPPERAQNLLALLAYPEDDAGGFMSTTILRAGVAQTVQQIREQLREMAEHRTELDAIAIVDDSGMLIADVPLFAVATADPAQQVRELIADSDEAGLVAVTLDADIDTVAERLVDSRHSSVLVCDGDGRPVGRILADDVLDAMTPSRGRRHVGRLLS